MKYKCEGAISVLHISSLIYNIAATFIVQAEEIFFMVGETLTEIQQNTQSNVVHLENIFSGSPGPPAFNIPREVLEMFVENKFNVSAMASMLEVNQQWKDNSIETEYQFLLNIPI